MGKFLLHFEFCQFREVDYSFRRLVITSKPLLSSRNLNKSRTSNLVNRRLTSNFSYKTDPKNEGGVVAALHNHDKFQTALSDAFGA